MELKHILLLESIYTFLLTTNKCITSITDDYNDTFSINYNCTDNDTNIELIIPLFTLILCGMSLMCLICLMVYIK